MYVYMGMLSVSQGGPWTAKDHDCAMLKQIRPDRPFWWHPSEQDGARCCWTSGWFCTPTIGHGDQAQRVQVSSWYLRRPQSKDIRTTLRPRYLPCSYIDPLGETKQIGGVRVEVEGPVQASDAPMVSLTCGFSVFYHGPHPRPSLHNAMWAPKLLPILPRYYTINPDSDSDFNIPETPLPSFGPYPEGPGTSLA